MAEPGKARDKGASETEKDKAGRSAEPSARNTAGGDEISYQDAQDASQALFGVASYVVVGAVLAKEMNTDEPLSRAEVKAAVEEFLKKEVK